MTFGESSAHQDCLITQVGPLPIGEASVIEQLYEDGDIPYVKRPSNDLPEAVSLVGEAVGQRFALTDVYLQLETFRVFSLLPLVLESKPMSCKDEECTQNRLAGRVVISGARCHKRYIL